MATIPCESDTVKIEKEKAMQRYLRLNKIATFATTLPFLLAFIFLSSAISHSPAAVEFLRLLFRRLCVLSVNHHFGFLLGNLIILTLFLKSRPSSGNGEDSAVRRAEPEPKRYRRTRSEEFERDSKEKVQLRRSETEPRRDMESGAEESAGKRRSTEVEDCLSNEEFQRKVEAFIQRQQRFLREESLSIALRNP